MNLYIVGALRTCRFKLCLAVRRENFKVVKVPKKDDTTGYRLHSKSMVEDRYSFSD